MTITAAAAFVKSTISSVKGTVKKKVTAVVLNSYSDSTGTFKENAHATKVRTGYIAIASKEGARSASIDTQDLPYQSSSWLHYWFSGDREWKKPQRTHRYWRGSRCNGNELVNCLGDCAPVIEWWGDDVIAKYLETDMVCSGTAVFVDVVENLLFVAVNYQCVTESL